MIWRICCILTPEIGWYDMTYHVILTTEICWYDTTYHLQPYTGDMFIWYDVSCTSSHLRYVDIISHSPVNWRPHVVGAQLYRLSTVDAHTDVLKPIHGKIIGHYSRYYPVAFCYEHKCELSYIHPGHDVKLHPHRVKLYRIGCVGSDLVLAKALT